MRSFFINLGSVKSMRDKSSLGKDVSTTAHSYCYLNFIALTVLTAVAQCFSRPKHL